MGLQKVETTTKVGRFGRGFIIIMMIMIIM
jgi:hypothetical protein